MDFEQIFDPMFTRSPTIIWRDGPETTSRGQGSRLRSGWSRFLYRGSSG